ncbi:MAG: lamin tail domain-containing protein, partial [Methanomassiliicoccales archaeon]
MAILLQLPSASAATVDHTNAEVNIMWLNDWGRIQRFISTDGSGPQTVSDIMFGCIGLVIDQGNYDHTPGFENIADPYTTPYYTSPDDFETQRAITLITDGELQISTASYMNTGSGTGDPNDILINQTAWTVDNKDWAVIQYTLTNVRSPAQTLTDVCIGLELPLSQVGGRGRVGGDTLGDGGDDVDGFDAVTSTYWVEDAEDTVLGVSSAIDTDPINHYFGQDYHADYSSEYIYFFENDTWLYERMHAENQTATDGITPGNITTTVGWNGTTLLPGESRTFTYVISVNDSFNSMINAIKDAQDYYSKNLIDLLITEFTDDSTTQRIEIYNKGREVNLTEEDFFISLDGGNTALSGSWDKDFIPMYEYAVFTLVGTPLGPEGGTLGLYQDLGGGNKVLRDGLISFGQNGTVPDPQDSESAARHYDDTSARYTDDWLRNSSTGPTWGYKNDVPPVNPTPTLLLNEIMFFPNMPSDGFVELYLTEGTLDISGYKIVGDSEYTIPAGTILTPDEPYFYLTYNDDWNFFDALESSGDNIYLYNDTG